jgi:DNA ligase-1
MITKPMLAASMTGDFKDLTYPLIASVKVDGIRCLIKDGVALSRSFKPIPNLYIQEKLSVLPSGLDGELIILADTGEASFNDSQSGIMTVEGTPNFCYVLFDYVEDSLIKPYRERFTSLINLNLPSYCSIVQSIVVDSAEELLSFEEVMVSHGKEGIMTRSANGPYKCGRATFKSQDLVKIKRFIDSEAIILGFEEQLHNNNEATIDNLGHTKRSSHKDNMIRANTLGTLLVRDIISGIEFGIGTGKGLTAELKKAIWENKEAYLGRIITYRSQKCGAKDKPRIPSFHGFRDDKDMDTLLGYNVGL